MDLFGSDDRLENQVEIYENQIDTTAEKLEKLDGVDNPEAAQQREALTRELEEINLKLEQTHHAIQQRDASEHGAGLDFFND